MNDYYSRKKSNTHEYRDRTRNPRKDWKQEFMKSLTYELTTIYAEQIANNF